MLYSINLGCWNSVFAVPTDIVDKYLKIAGSAQIKVLLYILRNSGKTFSEEDISSQLNIDIFDVKDCIEFWVSFGVINMDYKDSNEEEIKITPAEYKNNETEFVEYDEQTEPAESNESFEKIPENSDIEVTDQIIEEKTTPDTKDEKLADVVVARPVRPDPVYISKRIDGDNEFSALLEEVQIVYGRPISNNETAGILMLHDNEGLPCEVILMLITYGIDNGMGMRQIEALGATWAKNGINSVPLAEAEITRLDESKECYRKIQKLFGLEFRKPSKKEEEMYSRWIKSWKISDELLKEAFEICIDMKGKYIPNYVNTILFNWQKDGIKTPDEVKKQAKKVSADNSKRSSSFDIDDISNLTLFND